MISVGGYHVYTGGCSVYQGYHEYTGEMFSTLKGYHKCTGGLPWSVGVIMSTPGDVQYTGGIP